MWLINTGNFYQGHYFSSFRWSTHFLDVTFGLGVEAAIEIGGVSLLESRSADRVGIIIVIDAASSKDGAVDVGQEATIRQVQSSDDVGTDGILLVVLAPVDVGPSSAAGAVQDMGWANPVQFGLDGLPILHTDRGHVDLFALALQDLLQVAGYPALAAPDKESRRHG